MTPRDPQAHRLTLAREEAWRRERRQLKWWGLFLGLLVVAVRICMS